MDYIDPIDGARFPLAVPRWRADAGRPLWIEPGPGIRPDELESVRSIWRYRAALPVQIDRPITLGEGLTPLVEAGMHGGSVLLKMDFLNPTGSFKDRGSAVMLSYLRQYGIRAVLEDSSGNGGASIAGYAAAGGLHATIFAPASTSPSKISQVRAYGADVVLVPGPRHASQDEAMRRDGDAFYASHNWQPFFLQGTKTLAYELWEDLDFRAPDNIIVPVGAGSSLLGCWLGFTELLRAGSIVTMPRLFASQPLNCSPVDAAARGHGERQVLPTIAEGTAIARPLRLAHMLEAMRGGGSAAVTESEIVDALAELCSIGIFVEPTSATAVAAHRHLRERGVISTGERTVILLTGSGLKAGQRIEELLA